MLIKSLDAKNFRKYQQLTINDIPESGVITIAGSNESGKTSIGEAICFALFGRTFFLDENNLQKIVCWGQNLTEVSLTFKSGDGETFSIWRSVNRNGEINVKLSKLEENSENDSPIEDKEKVEQALSRILGFNFDAFSNSFYLAQRELTSPDPQSYSIKQMAGIAAYSEITDDLDLSIKENEASIEKLAPELADNQDQLDDIDLDETWLPELIDAEEILGNEQKGRETLVGRLVENETTYGNNFTSFHGAKKSSGFFKFFGILSLLATLILWGLWVLNEYYPEALIEFIAANFSDRILTSFAVFGATWLFPAAIISLLLAIFSWIMCKNAKSKMQSLNAEASDLSEMLDHGHGFVTTSAETMLPERIVQLLHQNNADSAMLQSTPNREEFNSLTTLIGDANDYQADPEEMLSASNLLSKELAKQDAEVADLGNSLLNDINNEKSRSDEAVTLGSKIQELSTIMEKCSYSIDTQNIAIGIMQRSASDSIDTFNKKILDVSSSTLPNFTQNRYSKIKIAEDFSVQIYSDEKKGYMDFDEISSGTQRQVMLSLRIAMSEQLSINSGNEEQFIFLDEPFAFFDQTRSKATLDALPEISDVINQIWISAQEFPDYGTIAKKIKCPSDQAVLIV